MRGLVAAWIVCSAAAGVVDRIAVVVGKTVITESEVMEEVRITEFLNGQPLDLGPEARRAAAERLVDQDLIRNEMQIGHYPEPKAEEADAMLARLEKERFSNAGSLEEALAKYGLTEAELKRHLLWQIAVLRFTDQRFRVGLPAATGQGGANRAAPGSETVADAGGNNSSVDQQMEAWLKETRSQTRVRFNQEAFQ